MGWVFYFLLINGLIKTLGILSILLSASHISRHTHSAAVKHNSMLTRTQSCVHKYDSDCHSRTFSERTTVIKGNRVFLHNPMKGTYRMTSSDSNSQFSISKFALFFFNLWCISKTPGLWCQHFHFQFDSGEKEGKKIFSCFRRIRRKFSDMNHKLFHVKEPPVKERSACSILIFIPCGSRRGWWAKTLQPPQPHVRKGSCLTKLSRLWSRKQYFSKHLANWYQILTNSPWGANFKQLFLSLRGPVFSQHQKTAREVKDRDLYPGGCMQDFMHVCMCGCVSVSVWMCECIYDGICSPMHVYIRLHACMWFNTQMSVDITRRFTRIHTRAMWQQLTTILINVCRCNTSTGSNVSPITPAPTHSNRRTIARF